MFKKFVVGTHGHGRVEGLLPRRRVPA